ncbi:DUF4214 domain-containing protein [Cupriavidus necator]|uniref:DUF4214 domain-containing protein n=1 Tax=Cupriavidus necator TaxID=106590 RepID=A0A1U9UW69_CUPNE|nr:DUF4214 domain-containing protein [Cupriavidus necator]AQV96481.1 DUF4214 domain-containing protein [Cupriavidus necator]
MAISSLDQIQQAYIAYYGRPADPNGLTYWANQLDKAGGNLSVIINAFGNSAESTALYGGSSYAAQVNKIYNTLFGRDADTAGLNYYVQGIQNGQFTLASVALNVFNGAQAADKTGLDSKLAYAKSFTAAIDTTQEIIGYSGDSAANAARAALAPVKDAASLQTATSNLDSTVSSVTGQGTAGQTFTLTNSLDALTGTGGNDTFIATIDAAGNKPTLNTGDQIDGGAGTDTLKIVSVTADTPAVTLKNVETVQIQQLGVNSGAISAANWTGVTQVSNVNSTKNVTITDLGNNVKLAVAGDTAGDTTTLLFKAGALGTAATVALDLNGVGNKSAAGVVTPYNTVVDTTSASTDVVTGLTVNATGANYVTFASKNAGVTVANKVTSLTVTGTGSLNVAAAATEFGKLAKVDASANSGGITIDVSGSTATTLAVTGSSGKDVVTANAATVETIKLGAGDDTLKMGTGSNVTAADSYDGGDGTDTLQFTAASNAAAIATANLASVFTSFEKLAVGSVDGALDVSKFGVNYLVNAGDVTANQNVTGFTSGGTVELTQGQGTYTGFLNIGVKDATTAGHNSDVINVVLNAADTHSGAAETVKLGLSGIETVNVTSTTTDTTAPTATDGYVLSFQNDDQLHNVNLTGTIATTYTASATATGLQSVDFSGLAAKATIDVSAPTLTQGVAITAAQKDTTITGSAQADVIKGGAGNDIISGGKGADQIDLSAGGRDIVKIAANVQTGFTDSSTTAFDAITGFGKVSAAGTAINLSTDALFQAYSADASVDILKFDLKDGAGAAVALSSFGTASSVAFSASGGAITGTANVNNGVITLSSTSGGTIDSLAKWVSVAQSVDATAGKAVSFEFAGDTYVYVENGAQDAMVKLVGVTGVTGLDVAGAATSLAAGHVLIG